jgi:hypothetical protein
VLNKGRILKLADIIEEHPDNFDMGDVLSDVQFPADDLAWGEAVVRQTVAADLTHCGTTACIAGWAMNLWPAEVDFSKSWAINGARILGIPQADAATIFYAYDLDARQAADYLRRYVEAS